VFFTCGTSKTTMKLLFYISKNKKSVLNFIFQKLLLQKEMLQNNSTIVTNVSLKSKKWNF
jgi:hypothetical protein